MQPALSLDGGAYLSTNVHVPSLSHSVIYFSFLCTLSSNPRTLAQFGGFYLTPILHTKSKMADFLSGSQ